MKLRNQSLLAGFLFCGLMGPSLGEEGVLFQLRFEPGKSYLSATTMDNTSTIMMAGQEIKSVMKMELGSTQKVTAVENGVSVEQSINSIKMDANTGGMAMTFDSANPQGQLAAMLQPLMGAKTVMLLDAKGKVLSVEAPAIPGMEALGMGQEEMKQSAREMAEMMPNKEIAVGESWTAESLLPTSGMTEKPVTITYTMVFQGIVEQGDTQLAKVKIEGAIKDGDENIQVTSRELSGVMLFDPKLGQPVETTLLMDLEIGLPEDVPVAEGAAGAMPVKMKTVSRLVEVK